MAVTRAFVGFFEGRRRLGGPLAPRVEAFDAWVDRAVDRHRRPAADRFFASLTNAAEHGGLWLGLATVRAAAVPRHRRSLGRFALALTAESLVTNGVVKTAFRRLRPPAYYTSGPLPYRMRRPLTSAFPSGHAATAFTAATLLADGDRLAPAYYVLAALVAASRVYVRMHHASDVVAGGLWGLALGRLARRFVNSPTAS